MPDTITKRIEEEFELGGEIIDLEGDFRPDAKEKIISLFRTALLSLRTETVDSCLAEVEKLKLGLAHKECGTTKELCEICFMKTCVNETLSALKQSLLKLKE